MRENCLRISRKVIRSESSPERSSLYRDCVTDLICNRVHVSCYDRLMRSVCDRLPKVGKGLDPSRKYPLTRPRSMSGEISSPVHIITEQVTCAELGELTQS